MKMNPEEITAIIKDQIKNYDVDLNVDDVGTVIEIGDGIVRIGDKRIDGSVTGKLSALADELMAYK